MSVAIHRPIRTFVGSAVLLCILVFTLIDIRRVEGSSMAPTLEAGQVIVVFRLAYGFRPPFSDSYLFSWNQIGRGDIIVFRHPLTGDEVVKRCIGVPGDRLQRSDGYISINGTVLDIRIEKVQRVPTEIAVPKGSIYVVGDDRARSVDSRYYGLIGVDTVLGRVIMSDNSPRWEPERLN